MIGNQCGETGSSGSDNSSSNNNNSSSSSSGGGGEATGDASDTYFCGQTHTDAVSSCHKRCRTGSPGECPSGESCFRNVYQCTVEIPRADPTPPPTLSPPTLSPVKAEVTTEPEEEEEECTPGGACSGLSKCTAGQETCCGETYHSLECECSGGQWLCLHTDACMMADCKGDNSSNNNIGGGGGEAPPVPSPSSSSPTVWPTFSADNGTVQQPNLPSLYCASSREELEASCSTAQECVSGPCPSGQMCFPYECKEDSSDSATLTTTAKPTNSPTPPAITAEKIPLPDTNAQLFCASTFDELETTCSTTAQSCAGGQECPSGQWCYEYSCSNKVTTSDPVIENDAPEANPEFNGSGEQQPSEKPPQQSGTSYCASSIAQLNERCGLAIQCATDSDCSAQGEFCTPFDCRQNLMHCPLNFVGWHSSKDCKQYYYCEQGASSSSNSCGDGMKFDKTRDKCTTDFVDEFCYGLASYEHSSGSITKPGAVAKVLCPPGLTGWHSSDGACNEYQKCTAGTPGPTRVCGFGLKFDKSRGECIDYALVNIDLCVGPPPRDNLCPSGSFTGWGARNDCTEYFHCENGNADFVNTCADGLLFDMPSGICKPANAVNCGGKVNQVLQNPSLPSNNVVDTGSNSSTPPPAPLTDQDLDNSFEWSNAPPPTAPQSDSKVPEWMFKQDPNGAVRLTTLQVGLFTVASIYWMLL